MNSLFDGLAKLDPGPIFVISLFPYLIFLYWAQKSESIPKTSLLGFRLTLLFVFVTIVLSIISNIFYGKELTEIDQLHGSAEAFLALSDGLIVIGFANQIINTGK